MKTKIFIICMIFFIGHLAYAQSADSIKNNNSSVNKDQEKAKTEVSNKSNKQDTTKIRIGRKELHIVESDSKTTVDIIDLDSQKSDTTVNINKHKDKSFSDIIEELEKLDEADKKDEKKENSEDMQKPKPKKKFEGHWAGIGIGINNLVDASFSLARTSDNQFMDMNSGKSINVNINLIEYEIPLCQTIGIITGLGLDINNFRFDRNNSITKDVFGNTVELIPPVGSTFYKSKLTLGYLAVPLLVEFQIPVGEDPIYFSGGVIGELRTWSYTKRDGNKQHDDFNIPPLRYGLQARAGYKALNLYATYFPTPLFEANKGPELYPSM